MPEKEIKIPQADKIVGIPSEIQGEDLDKISGDIKKMYETKGVNKIEALELEKAEKDLKIINFVQDSVTNLLKRYGRDVSETPLKKIHILRTGGTEEYTEGRLRKGAHSSTYGSVLIDREKSDAEFAIILFHELLHNKSYKVLQFTTNEDPELKSFRSGFSITTRDGKTKYFEQTEEALIQILVIRFYTESILNNEIFELNEPFEFSRGEEIEKLEDLIDELWENNKNDFNSRDNILELFINGQINGKLLPVARLIEKTFGKGSFRAIGKETIHKDD